MFSFNINNYLLIYKGHLTKITLRPKTLYLVVPEIMLKRTFIDPLKCVRGL